MTTKFKAGATYSTRSICDHDCIISFNVLRRTDKTLRIKDDRGERTLRISLYDGREQVRPWGSYSMCPIMDATDEVVAEAV